MFGVVRLASDQFDNADGERRMASSIDRLLTQDIDAAVELIKDTLRLKTLFSPTSRARFARLVHEKFQDRILLETINEEFQDAYSSHRLLAPLAERLKHLSNQYEGIQW